MDRNFWVLQQQADWGEMNVVRSDGESEGCREEEAVNPTRGNQVSGNGYRIISD